MDTTKTPTDFDPKNAQVKDVFKPGTSIELVFNIDSMQPIVRSAILYDCDYASSQVTVSQTRPMILPSASFQQMHMTTLVHTEYNRKFRTGIDCRILEFLNNYKLSGSATERAVLIEYAPPLTLVNIRSAFRLEPNERYQVEGVIKWHGDTYRSEEDFTVANISFTGIGILVPIRSGGEKNRLLEMETTARATIELKLIRKASDPGKLTISSVIRSVRVYPRYNTKKGYLGAKFSNLSDKDEEALSKFIHEAQLYDIRKTNRTLEE
jgi:c-di-GMP-binding flagellar brake protein YcgR